MLEGDIEEADANRLADKLLADSVVEKTVVAAVGDERLQQAPINGSLLVHVINKPGVMDPVAMSAQKGIEDLGIAVDRVRTFRKYWVLG